MASLNINGYNIGADISLTIRNDFGDQFTAVSLGHLMRVEATMDFEQLKVTPITGGGLPLYEAVPNGASGTMEFTRYNGEMARVFATLMNAFYNQGILPHWAIEVNVMNRDMSVDDYTFSGVVFTRPQFGNFDGIREVTQTLEFGFNRIVFPSNISTLIPALQGLVGTYNALTGY